jgi:glycosyltransferase involved in cell wall biosynthesis
MNAAACSAISKFETVNYVGPIDPPVISWQKAISKLRRVAGSQGSFFVFSEPRLKRIADEVHFRSQSGARLDFFHGFTPWIMTQPQRPYITWSDCTFRDYVDIFHRREHFSPDDLERIEQAEASWLRNAQCVLFTSDWAAQRALRDYSLDASRVRSVGIFGELDMPLHDTYVGGKDFAFVSTNFEAKGGRIVLAAFRETRKSHFDARLIVVGDRPNTHVSEPGVTFTGFLRKEIPDEYHRFRQVLAEARALVNASKSDTCPVLLVEAGYVGCPVISIRRFAIAEIIEHRRNGFLLDEYSPSVLSSAMCWMLEHPDEYQEMRQAAWAEARKWHSKERFEQRLIAGVCEGLACEKTQL